MEAEYGRRHRHRKAALAFLQDLLRNLRPTSKAAVGAYVDVFAVICSFSRLNQSTGRSQTNSPMRTGAYLQAKETTLLQPRTTSAEWEDERACVALVTEVIRTVAHTCPENRYVCM